MLKHKKWLAGFLAVTMRKAHQAVRVISLRRRPQ